MVKVDSTGYPAIHGTRFDKNALDACWATKTRWQHRGYGVNIFDLLTFGTLIAAILVRINGLCRNIICFTSFGYRPLREEMERFSRPVSSEYIGARKGKTVERR
jgi:hypothetical protein